MHMYCKALKRRRANRVLRIRIGLLGVNVVFFARPDLLMAANLRVMQFCQTEATLRFQPSVISSHGIHGLQFQYCIFLTRVQFWFKPKVECTGAACGKSAA